MQEINFKEINNHNMLSNDEMMDILCSIEKRFESLFEIKINGIEPYLWIRPFLIDAMMYKRKDLSSNDAIRGEWKKYISIKRIIRSFFDILFKTKRADWIIFTSAIHRRDKGRNLVAEYYLNSYPDALVLESPSRNIEYSKSYKDEPYKNRYILLDFYFCVSVIWNKIYGFFFRKKKSLELKKYELLINQIFQNQILNNEEKGFKDLVLSYVPTYCVELEQNHMIAGLMFRTLKAKNFVDYSGHLFELLYPCIKDKTVPFYSIQVGAGSVTTKVDEYCIKKKIEMKSYMSGVIELVYSDIIKQLMIKSGYNGDKIQVIGNLRLKMYEKVFGVGSDQKNIILFISQPHGSDPFQSSSYMEMSNSAKEISKLINTSDFLKGCKIVIKLHPLETDATAEFYRQTIDQEVDIISDAGGLYDLLKKSKLIVTKNSTVAMEASYFNTPTIFVGQEGNYYEKTYGVSTVYASNPKELRDAIEKVENDAFREQYIKNFRNLISDK